MSRDSQPRPKNGSTAQEVARRAGVSVMTVSRALRGSDDVAPRTRERVLAIASELGYQPNSAARSLRTGTVQTVGFITWSHHALRGSYHSETLAGLNSVMESEGHSLLIAIPSKFNELTTKARQTISMGQAAGLVIQGTFIDQPQIDEVAHLNAPAVLMNYSGNCEGASCVGYDNEGGVEQAVRHLVTLGHRRIAYIGGTEEDQDAKGRERGFRQAMQRLGLPLNEEWMRPGHFAHAVESGSTQADHLLAEGESGPTAIVCAADNIAIGVIESARRSGRRVPEDISVVGFDNMDFSAHLVPPLTSVDHSGWDLGVRVGEELLRLMRNGEAEPRRVVLPTRLVIRDSTARPKAD